MQRLKVMRTGSKRSQVKFALDFAAITSNSSIILYMVSVLLYNGFMYTYFNSASWSYMCTNWCA